MLCKDCHQRKVTKKSYKGLCSACRSKRYDYSKGCKCSMCGILISNRAKLCEKHMHEQRNKHIERICEVCGKVYSVKPSDNIKYCSSKCSTIISTKRLLSLNVLAIKETETIEKQGYATIKVPGRKRRVRVHIVKAEKILGRRLKKGECVHHWDLDKSNNENFNLIICMQDYHLWLHHQMAVQWVKRVLLPSRAKR